MFTKEPTFISCHTTAKQGGVDGLLGQEEGRSSMYSCLMMSTDHLSEITRSSNIEK